MRLFATLFILLAVIVPAGVFGQSGSTTITETSQFVGNVTVVGALSKTTGSFVIDHPLDPKNKLLYHSFVESPDAKNIYDGIAVLDERGEAVVELPSYFLALNKDFRYLVTPIARPAPNLHMSREVSKRWGIAGTPVFKITGGNPGQKVSWQVSGVRKDPYILDNPIEVEVEKGSGQPVGKGEYLAPEAYE